MSKELEALERILDGTVSVFNLDDYYIVSEFVDEEDLDIIKQALTPPTAEDVCNALRERYSNAGIHYLVDRKSFVYGSMLRPICWLKEDETIYWATNDLTPYLVTLIGRFYEGVGK